MQGCSPSSPAGPRLWRPAAQRSLRNSWSSISMHLSAWFASSSLGLSAASSLVNTLLSRRYIEFMDFGVLKAMNGIQSKAHTKLFYQGEACFLELLTSYKSLVESLTAMQKAKKAMRAYLKGPATGPFVEFTDQQHLDSDAGDGDGLAVFSALSVYTHEMLAQELLDMFIAEIKIKWLVILELHFLLYSGVDDYKKAESKKLMYSVHVESASKLPGIFDGELEHDAFVATQKGSDGNVKREVLEVYLTAWLAEVNISNSRWFSVDHPQEQWILWIWDESLGAHIAVAYISAGAIRISNMYLVALWLEHGKKVYSCLNLFLVAGIVDFCNSFDIVPQEQLF